MSGLVLWLSAHWGSLLAPLLVAIIDFLWAINPSLKASGPLHAIYLWLKGSEQPPQQPPAA